jgi:hypothetical protein
MKLSPRIQVGGIFFNDKSLTGQVDKAKLKAFSKFGAFVRQTARKSIKRARRGQQSIPGNPPLSRTGTLRRLIFFTFDRKTDSVIIGPALLSGRSTSNPPTQAVEKGGRSDNGYIYRAFPFMQPAFDKELPKARLQFANIIK